MYSYRNLLTSLLVFILFVNAIGITQVSHICSMATSPKNWDGIQTSDCESHNCCPEDENAASSSPESEDCCKDVVKYFQQKVNTTLNPLFKIQPALAVISHFLYAEKLAGQTNFSTVLPEINFSPHDTGKSILISKQSFLI